MTALEADPEVPACPGCGARRWLVNMAVEVQLVVAGEPMVFGRLGELNPPSISAVVVTSPTAIGEGDVRCGMCGELLLDWSAAGHDDPAWQAHHDERRPALELVHDLAASLTLPPPNQWGSA
jgi:hypothetical protein